MKLKASITSNSMKLIDVFNKITSGALITGPDFQRKLVWKKQHKYAFIKTILLNFPFPEVYIASSEVDVVTLQAKEIVVDGQQRLTTIVDYIKGSGDFANQNQVTPFDELSIDDKKDFLNYSVTVKDLKDIGIDNIKEVFKRINSTDYSLNSNEILNAQFGDGEFSIFCKQIVYKDFEPSEEITDVILDSNTKTKLNSFFEDKKIFSDNDVRRMFDIQYIMLLTSTILEGKYFGRSTRINHYLEKYNGSFDVHQSILDKVIKSIHLIDSLKLSSSSYWFNKANLFTLIIEFSKVDENLIDLDILESKLLELEKKVDVYFTDEDISMISDEERKYFEFARQGSHELAAREHRAKVIRDLITESTAKAEGEAKAEIEIEIEIENKNLEMLANHNIDFSILIPTETGLKKSIMDAVSGVREFLKTNDLHNYETQESGPDHKKKLEGYFITDTDKIKTEISLYRSNGRGDFRIWFSDLKSFVSEKEELALLNIEKTIYILNVSRYNYEDNPNLITKA
ncbi:DUF262 domain-containing protein [Flavobacterium lipolyticum]|uniref:DUF262 domain-containing protein n=1 Tax=Flavobacterium lipolyticum TaxID=2893754 RepID=A0ABS8LZS4_9FLAO|nr:DUF262 domain-containing protein [Flavobacterium sp. F-126]MCC9018087.1 DUF262 domain-containing protein [Flavobacterium sp. F-126]